MEPQKALLRPVITLDIHSAPQRQHDASPVNLGGKMPQDAPKCPIHMPLSAPQRTAVHLVLAGASDADVASALTIDRKTVYRWRTRHPEFIAEMNRRRRDMWTGMNDHVFRTVAKALAVAENSLDLTPSGRATSLKLLQLLLRSGLQAPSGPMNAETAKEQIVDQGLAPSDTDIDPLQAPKLPRPTAPAQLPSRPPASPT